MSDDFWVIYTIATQMADVNDDSHVTEFSDMDIASDDYHTAKFLEPLVEVKMEDVQDVKQEPTDEFDAAYLPLSVQVCVRCICLLTLGNYFAFLYIYENIHN